MRLVYIIHNGNASANYVYQPPQSRSFPQASPVFPLDLKHLFQSKRRKKPADTRFCVCRSATVQYNAALWKSEKNLRSFYRFSTKHTARAALPVEKRRRFTAGCRRLFPQQSCSAASAVPASAPCWRRGTGRGTPAPRSARPGWPPPCGAARPRCRCWPRDTAPCCDPRRGG